MDKLKSFIISQAKLNTRIAIHLRKKSKFNQIWILITFFRLIWYEIKEVRRMEGYGIKEVSGMDGCFMLNLNWVIIIPRGFSFSDERWRKSQHACQEMDLCFLLTKCNLWLWYQLFSLILKSKLNYIFCFLYPKGKLYSQSYEVYPE